MATVDFLTATVPKPPRWLVDALHDRLPDCEQVTMERPSNGRYDRSVGLFRDDLKIAEVMTGDRYEYPYLLSTGHSADEVTHSLRSVAPVHYVTRIDTADDFLEPGLYDSAVPLLAQLAEKHRVKLECGGDWVRDKMPGRTLYLGSKESVWRGVLYDKTEEQRRAAGSNSALRESIPENWTRFETRARPKGKEARLKLASVAPADLVGTSAIGVEVARQLLSRDVARLPIGTVWRQTDVERAEWTMIGQYMESVLDRLSQLGDDSLYGPHVRNLIEQIRASRTRA